VIKESRYGGTMRLGAYDCSVEEGTIAHKAYGKKMVKERHRHRFEVNSEYIETLKKNGLVIAGKNPNLGLVEIIEVKKHPFFVGVQFHPEFKSRPLSAHPMFVSFIRSAIKSH